MSYGALYGPFGGSAKIRSGSEFCQSLVLLYLWYWRQTDMILNIATANSTSGIRHSTL